MRHILLVLFAAFALLLSVSSMATDEVDVDSTSSKPDRGWFWYEYPSDEKKPEEQPAKADAAQNKEKKPMSAAWMRKMLPIMHERAADNPTRENLAAEAFLKRAIMDKSQRYSEEMQKFIYSEPLLDENNRIPLSAYGKNEFMNKEFAAKEKALKHLAKNVGGLFVFFDSKCDFCKAQVKILNYMKESYGFKVKYISMDGKGLPGIKEWVPDNGHAKLLDLKVYPTTVFAVPPSTYLIVSQGMMAKDQLTERILTAAGSNKLLSDEMEKDVNPWDRGVLTADDMQDGAYEDPDEFVKYMREKLKARY